MTIRRPIVSVGGQFEQMPAGDRVPADVLPSNVSALAALIGAANTIAYFTGPGAMNLADFTVFARLWCALADAAAGRTLLELGTAATRNATTTATDTTSERLWRTNDLVKNTSNTDTTAGRLLRNGDHGLGATTSIYKNNLDTVGVTGFYFALNGDTGVPGPGTWFVFHQQGNNSTRAVQYAASAGSGGYWVRRNLDGSWSDWQQMATTASAAGKTKVVTARTGTSYTFVLADNIDVYNRFTNAGESTCTVPPNSSVPYPVGHVIPVRRAAAANLTLTPGSGVTLNAPSGGTLVMTNNMTAELIKVGTNEWDVVGQTVAA